MARNFAEIAFTPSVREFQTRMGSLDRYAALDGMEGRGTVLTDRETEFISERDGFYQATVGETGWPYVQFRGGPAGFLKVLDPNTIGYADFRGNVQYISAGNLAHDGRIALILMDYAQRRRLKLWGRARLVDTRDDAALTEQLEVPSYRARVERAVIITVEAFDWNCPQHITPRYTEAEVEAATANLRGEVARLRAELERLREQGATSNTLGDGPLALVIDGVRQLTPRIRAYTLRTADGSELPAIAAGAHLDVPVQFVDGRVAQRRYSIASDPTQRDAWEIAVLREDNGSGGSAAVHARFGVSLRLNTALPGNDFALHDDARPTVLIAGGIGITPIRAMAYALRSLGRDFRLHYAARSLREMAWADDLAREFGPRMRQYLSDTGPRLHVDALLRDAPADALFYVCGPARLIDAVRAAAERHGAADRVRSERFVPQRRGSDAPITVKLRRSGKRVTVRPEQTILEAVEAAGVNASFSCRNGTCGTCATKVLDGTPEHRDAALSDAERNVAGLMCICVSRASTPDLTLDL
ncbi:2Fe-2S iron-sulfur cluster binding domain-containing protein [Betaproteobacteria bacterium PRO7]|jgi:ferredoxin-NADP reductase/predicted pyridoxine 5'-phosphate oxidase superfamily flavin-nucleotide-binding protein|nr:2Fe-2S iron-sulfur cluster binding domain-containing protein [Betaproteobacteria bacterium PRO7]